MKKRNIIAIGCLTMMLGLGAFAGQKAFKKNYRQTHANGNSVTIYVSVLSSDIGNNDLKCNIKLGNTDWTNYQKMGEVENGITTSGRKVFSYTFTEIYGGANEIHLQYYVGGVEHYKKAVGTWKTYDEFNEKLFNFEATTDSDWSAYTAPAGYYSFIGTESSWTTDIPLTDKGNGTFSISKTFTRGEEFRFRENYCWYHDWNFGDNVSGPAISAFTSGSDNNFKCVLNGSYTFLFDPSTPSFVVSYDTDETYSFILTTKSGEYPNAYLYNSDSDKYTSWGDSPALSNLGGGEAYNVSIPFDNNSFVGLYKISDRYLSTFSHLILKGGSGQVDTIETSGSNKIYINVDGTSTTSQNESSAIYLASEFIYDLVTQRGAASYDGFNFKYSICAIDASVAAGLISRYEGFAKNNADVMTILDGTRLNTYDVKTKPYSEDKKTDVTIEQLIEALQMVVDKEENSGNSQLSIVVNENKSSADAIASIGAIAIASVSAAGFLFVRKKKLH